MCNNHEEHATVGCPDLTSAKIVAIGGPVPGGKLAEAMVHITTNDGVADAFFVHPVKDNIPESSCGRTLPDCVKQ